MIALCIICALVMAIAVAAIVGAARNHKREEE